MIEIYSIYSCTPHGTNTDCSLQHQLLSSSSIALPNVEAETDHSSIPFLATTVRKDNRFSIVFWIDSKNGLQQCWSVLTFQIEGKLYHWILCQLDYCQYRQKGFEPSCWIKYCPFRRRRSHRSIGCVWNYKQAQSQSSITRNDNQRADPPPRANISWKKWWRIWRKSRSKNSVARETIRWNRCSEIINLEEVVRTLIHHPKNEGLIPIRTKTIRGKTSKCRKKTWITRKKS